MTKSGNAKNTSSKTKNQEEDERNPLLELRSTTWHLSQADAARMAGVSRTLWSGWERRTRSISLYHLNILKKEFDLTPIEVDNILEYYSSTPRKSHG